MIERKDSRLAFSLIELLIVIAIISVLAAILFPVFVQARDKAREASCLSNEGQLSLAVQQYVTDYDERLFFRSGWNYSRSATVAAGKIATTPYNRWWNMLIPYVKSNNIWACPSDTGPTMSPDINNVDDIPRSYVADSIPESLTLAQVDDAAETIIVTEKWNNSIASDSWIEPFNGDMQPDNTPHAGRSWTVANRHAGFANFVFFDGHAKALRPETVLNSEALTGCELIYAYPFTPYDSSVPTVASQSSQNASNPPVEPNDCANSSFKYSH